MFDKDKNSQFNAMVMILLVMCLFIRRKSVRASLSRGNRRRLFLRASSKVPAKAPGSAGDDLDGTEVPACLSAGDDRAEAKTVGSSDKGKTATDEGKGVDTLWSVPEKRNHGSMESQSIWLLFLKYVTYPLRMLLFSVYMMFRGAAFILFDDRGSYRPAHSRCFNGNGARVPPSKSDADSHSSTLKIQQDKIYI